MSDKNIKNLTKNGNWQFTSDSPTNEHLGLSCLMRIADSTEAIAKNYLDLIKEFEIKKQDAVRYYNWFLEKEAENKALKRSITAHKANFTRLKNKLEAKT